MAQLHAGDNVPPSLPTMLTSFVGREREVAEISQLLESSPLVSLVGSGGCGKTRLALRVAGQVGHHYPDGVFWIELAHVADPALVLLVVAKTLNVFETPDTPLLDALLNALHERQTLLVLDNCEHLLEPCSQLVERLVEAKQLRILVTSREALGTSGETHYPVLPMVVPQIGRPFSEIEHYEAVQLFVERARAILPGFTLTPKNAEVVASICRDLDGIPLAIELASGRVNVLSVHQIQAYLNNPLDFLVARSRGEGRHHTLRATIDWSYLLLSPDEQLLLRRLSVFAGGFTLNTAEVVCAWGERAPDQFLESLTSLINKSLVVAETMQGTEARYHLLVTIRHYAQEKLRDAGEWSTLHDRYLSCFLQRTEEIAPKLQGQHQEVWLNWLEGENDNIRAALAWATEQCDTESGLRIAAALFQFWWVRGYIREGCTWYQRLLLLHTGAPMPLSLQIKALTNAAFLAKLMQDPQAAQDWAQRAVALCEAAGEAGKQLLGYALGGLGTAAMAVGDVATVFAVNERILELICNDGDNLKIQATHFILGMTAMTLGKYDVAHTHLDNALVFARESGNLYQLGRTLNSMGDLARCEERLEQARSCYEESLSHLRSLGDVQRLTDTLRNLAVVCIQQGDTERAHRLLCESVERSQAQDDREALGHSLQGFATLAAAVGLAEESAQLLGWAIPAIGVELQGADKLEFDSCKGLIRQQLSEAAFERAWAKGQAWPLEQAVALALSLPLEPDSPLSEGHNTPDSLTVREREIAGLIARGFSNGEIADALVLSKRTVEKHIANIFSKLHFTNRAQIVRWAMKPD